MHRAAACIAVRGEYLLLTIVFAVQSLLRKVTVRPAPEYSAAFPQEMPCRVCVHLGGGQILRNEKRAYPGFLGSPLPWDAVEQKFHYLSDPIADRVLREAIVNLVANLDQVQISELAELLARVEGVIGSQKTA